MFQQIDIAVVLRPAYDVFREEMVSALINWLSDMSQCYVGSDRDLPCRLIWRALNEPRQGGGMTIGTGLPPDLADLNRSKAKRLDWLLMEDPRLWKKPKWDLRSIYSRLYCVDWNIRKNLAVRIAHNYVRLFEHFLVQDREVDSGVLFGVSYMIFGNGEACAYACQEANLFTTVLNVAQAWFTGQVRQGKLTIPPTDIDRASPAPEHRIVPEHLGAFRGKKGVTVFGHVRSLFRHKEMQKLIGSDTSMFYRAAQFLNIFVGMQTQRKEVGEHIEFEVDWPRSFTYLGDLSKCARELGESMRYCQTPKDLLFDLTCANMRVYDDINMRSNIFDPTRYQKPRQYLVKNVLGPGATTRILYNDLADIDAFSFHHYMSLLSAEAFKALPLLTWRLSQKWLADSPVLVPVTEIQGEEYTAKEIIERIILKHRPASDRDTDKLSLMEHPLQSEFTRSLADRTRYYLSHPSRPMAEERSGYAGTSTSLSRCPTS